MPRYLPLPVVFDNADVKRMVEKDRHIERIIEMGKQANIALFTVGTVRDEALLFRLGYFNEEEKALLKNRLSGISVHAFLMRKGTFAAPPSMTGPSASSLKISD